MRNWFALLPAPAAAVSGTPARALSPATGARRGSVALLGGCAQQVFGQDINAASVRLLNRAGFDVHVLREDACCGAVEHHLGREHGTLRRVRRNVRSWSPRIVKGEFSFIINNASGCGTMMKDYAQLLRDDPQLAADAKRVSDAARDISEVLHANGLPPIAGNRPGGLVVACQNPCSMQHGQKVRNQPVELLQACGFEVREPEDGHACCGSAGTYNLLQGEFATRLGRQKGAALRATNALVIASGNLGCMLQIRRFIDIPIVHTVQLLDWATGGPLPAQFSGTEAGRETAGI